MHTTHTSRSQSRTRSHVFHEENARTMQLEIDHLRRKLCRERRRKTPSTSVSSSSEKGDGSYRLRSRTPPSESFSGDKDYHRRRRSKDPSCKDLGNDAMSRALNQIFRSTFTHKIKGGRLPWQFTQPTFTMYNGRTDPVEHVSHFN